MTTVNKTYLFHAIFLIFILTILACKKHTGETEKPNPTKENSLHFRIQGVQDVSEPELNHDNIKASKSGPARRRKIAAESEIVSLDGIDAIMTVTEDAPSQYPDKLEKKSYTVKNNQSRTSGNGNLARAISQLKNGVRYKIVLYKADSNGKPIEFVDQADGQVGGTDVSIEAYRNTNYRWYAYSYNNNSPLEVFVANQTSLPVKPSGNNNLLRQDFAYATGIIRTGNVIGGNSSINNIVLTRKTAQIILEINSRGMFGAVSYASPRFKDNSGLAKADFRLIDSSYQSPSNMINAFNVYNHHGSGYSVPEGTDSVPEADWKRRYTFYTVANGSAPVNLVVSLDTLRISSERISEFDGTSYFVERNFFGRNFIFPNFTPQAGKSYFISIKLVESAIPIGNTMWARANVYRNAKGPRLPGNFWEYRFRYDNPLYISTSVVPPMTEMFTNDIYSIGGKNICERIYPEGVWDLPTREDFNELDRYSNKEIIREPGNWYLRFIPYNSVPLSIGYVDGYLNLVPIGYKRTSTEDFSQYFPSSSRFRETKGYWRTTDPSVFARVNFSINSNDYINTGTYTATWNACIRCIRKKG
ncbi:hypothetical protein [Sphingobacterium sp.]|uniref:hypothetical protein n=1 Tax=Sphingobacterium sp. TaxID=341027 RepID=UPI0028ABA83C|nr:hypothetical protein [Sphingobacterium sp.]